MDTIKKTNVINIYTLAEKDILLAHLKNMLGWAPVPTYGALMLEYPTGADTDHQIMEKAYENGIRIRAAHIFRPLCESRFPQYNRHFQDDAIRILREILKEFPGMLSLVDSPEMRIDLETLMRFSPPLYEKAVNLIENL